jgi:hypothetical protein
MEESRDLLSCQVQQLNQAVADLQRRLAALEQRSGRAAEETANPQYPALAKAAPPGSALVSGEVVIGDAGSLVPLFGWAFVGLAGAYLLRAMTEAGAIPGSLGAGAGLLYAAWWLFLAARRAKDKPLFSTVHAVTAALILAPLLWEATVRFHLLSAPAAAVVLVCFAVLGLAIGWRQNIHPVAWVATLVGLVTITALFRETHDGRAWIATILAIAAAVEFSACRDHWLGLRWVVAIAADLGVLALTLLVTSSAAASSGLIASAWFVLAAQIVLLLIYMSSTVDRTIFRGLTISWFEVGQAIVAFVVAVGGALRLAEATSIASTTVGLCCLAGGLACYAVSIMMRQHSRNFYTYSTFAVLLTTAASWLLFSAGRPAVWSVLAVVMIIAGLLGGRTTLRVHAAVYLLMAAVGGSLVSIAASRVIVTGAGQSAFELPATYWFVLAGVTLCYASVLMLGDRRSGHWTDQVETAIFAGLTVWGFAGVVAASMLTYVTTAPPLRTALLTVLAASAAWVGTQWDRRELVLMAYPLLAAGGLKIVLEDLGAGRSWVLFASLVLFGGTLILLPRLMRSHARFREDRRHHTAAAS